ncbi:acyl-CoA dehydrogenase C-terminal domain-containing protein, partial [Micromonospora sp. NPDC007271]|uniref:acyl-CoA dehydrogenase C-terminal domain-containing protein n=1 Tax=Micromonospora sp. NPDC007271 TaxID=3154587 RepID=UPI0033C0C256
SISRSFGHFRRASSSAVRVAVDDGEIDTVAGQLGAAVDRIAVVTRRLWGSGDPELALANASIYLEAVGHVVIGWMWLEQLLAVEALGSPEGAEGDFLAGKRQAARYFYRYELPRVGPQFELLDSLDQTTLDARAAWF